MKLLKRSTRALLQDTRGLGAVHTYVYCKSTAFYLKYLAPLLILLRGRKWFANTYHSKILTTEAAKEIITIDRDIPLQDLEKVIPYPVARNIVLTNPLDIVLLECPCRSNRAQPCGPTQVCIIIGKPFTDFLVEQVPDKARRASVEEAMAVIELAHSKGWVHTAWFKDACLERFYAICNCCKCCCSAISGMMNYHIPMLAASGYVAVQTADLCINCGRCQKVCAFKAIDTEYHISAEQCMGCGACISVCKPKAIRLVRDESKGIPLEVHEL